jgi:hypothetical protein
VVLPAHFLAKKDALDLLFWRCKLVFFPEDGRSVARIIIINCFFVAGQLASSHNE